MMRTETFTIFNDMCIFAPGACRPAIRRREIDELSVEATYTNGPQPYVPCLSSMTPALS
jgi:hypothetical protein